MKVAVVGIAGAMGRLVASLLLGRGHEVAGIDRRPWPDAPRAIQLAQVDIRKRAAEDVLRKLRPEAVVHMATVNHFAAAGEERYHINLGGTRAVFDHCRRFGVAHCVFVGRHTYYGADAESPLYHAEDEPPMGLGAFPELADLVSADLYAGSALWRFPDLCTTVLRLCYTLGPSGHGTLCAFLRGKAVPTILGFDPLFQFLHERDVVEAIALAVEKRPRGVFNVAGPPPVPLSVLARATGRRVVPLPEPIFGRLLGPLLGRVSGLPRLPRGALSHLKYPIVIDATPFARATGFSHAVSEVQAMREFRETFPAA